ncbi:MAG: glycyl-radical enzyme activating protein [Armatimonadota bacterium]|nr:glycyl-radical enzyme activating protein [Armatimonadota bacterium]
MSGQKSHNLLVLNVGFTVELDGPGQRMVVYLKGCNMRCPWCAAPESISPRPEALFYPGRLNDSSRAITVCPHGAITVVEDAVQRNTAVCDSCDTLECLNSDNPAFERAGEEIGVQELVEKVIRYKSFFPKLGGVTIGGGEPTCQFSGVKAVLAKLREKDIHTAIETNGTSKLLPRLFPTLDLLFIDLKHPDNKTAEKLTGQGNEIIMSNIRERHAQGGQIIVRICLVPGFNSDDDTLNAFGSILSEIGPLNVEILPFHRRGEVKWKALGHEYPSKNVQEPSPELVQHAQSILSNYGLKVR